MRELRLSARNSGGMCGISRLTTVADYSSLSQLQQVLWLPQTQPVDLQRETARVASSHAAAAANSKTAGGTYVTAAAAEANMHNLHFDFSCCCCCTCGTCGLYTRCNDSMSTACSGCLSLSTCLVISCKCCDCRNSGDIRHQRGCVCGLCRLCTPLLLLLHMPWLRL